MTGDTLWGKERERKKNGDHDSRDTMRATAGQWPRCARRRGPGASAEQISEAHGRARIDGDIVRIDRFSVSWVRQCGHSFRLSVPARPFHGGDGRPRNENNGTRRRGRRLFSRQSRVRAADNSFSSPSLYTQYTRKDFPLFQLLVFGCHRKFWRHTSIDPVSRT